MPILWRYLLRGYFQIFLLCVTAFICVLLVMRLEEIARFASLGAPWTKVLVFAFYQIPYILPLAVPVSCLIACSLLFQKMSHSHELTALRSSGCSLRKIIVPLLFASGLLALFNIVLSCELAPRIRSFFQRTGPSNHGHESPSSSAKRCARQTQGLLPRYACVALSRRRGRRLVHH